MLILTDKKTAPTRGFFIAFLLFYSIMFVDIYYSLLIIYVMKSQFSFENLIDGWNLSIKPEELPTIIEKLGTVFDIPNGLAPGMYVYADGLISSEIIKNRQIMAIVGFISQSKVLAVCLQQTRLNWSSAYVETQLEDTDEMRNGQEATRILVNRVRAMGFNAEAAEWCFEYDQDGVKKHEAFLPSLLELGHVFSNRKVIDASLQALHAELLDGWYLSSCSYDFYNAWKLKMSDGTVGYVGKNLRADNCALVRPLLDLTSLSLKKEDNTFETPKEILPGMYVYTDGLIYPEILPNRQVMAVVGSVSDTEILAVCLRQKRLAWGMFYATPDLLKRVGTDKEEIIRCPHCGETLILHQKSDGKELTRLFIRHTRNVINNKIDDKSQIATSAAWCYDYNLDGVEKYSAFLPSLTELRAIYSNRDAVNPSLKALGVEILEGWYWPSSLYDSCHAWKLRMNDGTIKYDKVWAPEYYEDDCYDMNKKIYTRPVLRLKRLP